MKKKKLKKIVKSQRKLIDELRHRLEREVGKVFEPEEEQVAAVLERVEPPPPLDRNPIDLFDNEALIDGANNPSVAEPPEPEAPLTLQAYAQKHGRKATDVLIKLLSAGRVGIHINSILTGDDILLLEEDEKKGPFPSPDKQPPFTPRRSPLEGSVRLDGVSNPGARGSFSRGIRYD